MGVERPFAGCRPRRGAGTVAPMRSNHLLNNNHDTMAMFKLASIITLIAIALATLIVTAAPL